MSTPNPKIEQFITSQTEELVSYIRKTHPSFTCEVKMDYSPRRRCHRGGLYVKGPGISMAMVRLPRSLELWPDPDKVIEYPSFANDSAITDIYTTRPRDKVALFTIHEVTHAWQWYRIKLGKDFDAENGHGVFFRRLYRELRNQFLNPFLEDQTLMKQKYLSNLASIKHLEFARAA